MAKKLQQFFIYKINSKRLIQDNLNIELNINQARKNGELVSIGDSQMLRSLRDITGKNNYEEELQILLERKRKLKHKDGNSLDLYNIENRIDEILFVPEIISITVDDNRHYIKIIKDGLFINNKKFVRLMCSAGQARRNNVLLVDSNVEIQLKNILNNGRADIEITPAKFNAYFALSSSTALQVTTPLFCIIPDCEVKRKEKVEWVEEDPNGDDIITPIEKELDFNLFDGQGLISPRMAQQWALDLELDYIPSCFIIRSNFIKGLVVVIDFVEYSDEIGKHIITDIYGNNVNIRDMDVILTASQFKLWNAFKSTQEYVRNCKLNKIGWGITRYAPKQEKNHTTLNYQFIQALNLDENSIVSLCGKTVEYFENIINNYNKYALLYLLGDLCDDNYDNNVLDKIDDPVCLAILLNNKLIEDPYIQNHIINSLNRKIIDSYIGNLIVDGQYSFLVCDPYAFLEYIFGLSVKGLLKEKEHYSRYWLNRKNKNIVAMRSPLTWKSEPLLLNLVENDKIHKWYKYLDNCCIFNVNGNDKMLLADCDADGDIICLTNQKDVINGVYGGLPISYENKKAKKEKIIESELYKADILGFFTKVGFLTNLSTTMYAMLPMFDEESKEYKEIIRRLKQARKEQGSIIDSTKGLILRPIPKQWTNPKKIKDDMSEEEISNIKFNNSILINKRPFFMSQLYSSYSKEYRKYYYNYNLYCEITFGMELESLLTMSPLDCSKEQQEFLYKFNKYKPLLDTDCTTNRICHHMQSRVREIKINSKPKNVENIVKLLKSKDFEIDKNKLDAMYMLFKKYKSEKRNFANIKNDNNEFKFKTIESFNKYIRLEAYKISSNVCELASLAVVLCYELYPSDNKSFCWNIFSEGLLENIRNNKQDHILFPFIDKDGDIEYLGKTYSLKEIDINEDYLNYIA